MNTQQKGLVYPDANTVIEAFLKTEEEMRDKTKFMLLSRIEVIFAGIKAEMLYFFSIYARQLYGKRHLLQQNHLF
jgi:hypothetical protein